MASIKILLVEDVPLPQKMAVIVLNGLDCEVDVADSGEQAIELATQNEYDLIFMDIGLPGIDGFTAAKKIRDLENEANRNHAPIIALTAHGDDSYQQRAFDSGMDDFLIKPLNRENSKTVLEQAALGKYARK